MAGVSLGPCFDCGEPAGHMHHVVPRSLGGSATVPLCTDCHAKAHNLPAGSWGNHRKLTKQGIDRRRESGKKYGTIPYGLTEAEGGNLKVCREEWRSLQAMRTMRESGQSIRKIAKALNEQGHKPRGKEWHPTTVARVMKAHGI